MVDLSGITFDSAGRFYVAGDSTTHYSLASAIAARDKIKIQHVATRPAYGRQKPFYTNYDSRREQDMGRRSTKRKRESVSMQASPWALESVAFASPAVIAENNSIVYKWGMNADSYQKVKVSAA